MMKIFLPAMAALLLFAPLAAEAQHPKANPAVILLHNAELQPASNAAEWNIAGAALPGESFGGYYFRLLQFHALPDEKVMASLRKEGILLLDFIPWTSYIAAVPAGFDATHWQQYPLRSILQLSPENKTRQNLQELPLPEWAVRLGTHIDVAVSYYEVYRQQEIADAIAARGWEVLPDHNDGAYIEVRIPQSDILKVAALPYVSFVEAVNPEAVAENYTARTLHRDNVIASDYDGGRKYDGTGVTVAMGDDGLIGPHIDYQGRVDNSRLGASNTGNHGDHVGGTIMGAGNLDPRNKGMAFGANLAVYDVWDAVNDGPGEGMLITSTSYSNGCNAGYTSFARSADQQTRLNENLIHIFSAGNDGTTDCDYGAGPGWGNVTGGVKIGKNVICVADLSASDALASSSSRGPAADGRIKPDVGAKGTSVVSTIDPNTYANFSGTSMACPGVSGTVAQLYHAYKDLNGGVNPPSALIKAILMNSAEDLGNPGPDFKFGYGRVDALRAVLTLEDGRYLTDTAATGDTITHIISVPAGTAELRVMVYWHDREGATMSAPALVNNLDITLTDPGAAVWQPWILDPTPAVSALDADAVRGVDVLNNQEQVTLVAPAAGDYTLSVVGTAVPFGPQQYWVVYELIDSSITVTYPVGGESWVPGEIEKIRWDGFGDAGTWTVEMSQDSGTTWSTLSSSVISTRRYYDFSVPSTVTGKCLVRVSRGASSDMSEAPFSIIRVPGSLNVASSCPDYCVLQWNPVAGATSYEVSQLGTKYMDSIGTTTATTFTVPGVGQFDNAWFSVKAFGTDDAVGRRAVAVYKETGIWNCAEPGDAGIEEILNPSWGAIQDCHNLSALQVKVRLFNNSPTDISGIPIFMQLDGGTIVAETVTGPLPGSGTLDYTFATTINISSAGDHTLDVWMSSAADGNPYNDSASVNTEVITGSAVTLPVTENFESFSFCSTALACETGNCTMSNGFYNSKNTRSDDIDWRTDANDTPSPNTGPATDHNPGSAIGRYVYLEASGCDSKQGILITPCLDLTTSIKPELSYWFHMYGALMGELHVDAFTNGEWQKDITTVTTGDWTNKWWQKVIDLTAYKGGLVTLAFRGVTGGNTSDMALDDFSLEEKGVGVEDQLFGGTIRVFPNPTSGEFSVLGENTSLTDLSLLVTDVQGRTVLTHAADVNAGNFHVTLDLGGASAGIYFLHLRTTSGVEVVKVAVE